MVSGKFFRIAALAIALVVSLAIVAPAVCWRRRRHRAPSAASSATRRVAAIPGATVRVVNEDTGVTFEAVSNEQGSYRAAALLPGRYRVETTLDGFETAVRRVALDPGQTAGDRFYVEPIARSRKAWS